MQLTDQSVEQGREDLAEGERDEDEAGDGLDADHGEDGDRHDEVGDGDVDEVGCAVVAEAARAAEEQDRQHVADRT